MDPTPVPTRYPCTPWLIEWGAQQYVAAVLWPFVLVYVVAIVWIIARRKLRPIRGRQWGAVVFCDVVSFLLHNIMCFKMIFRGTWPCIGHLYDSNILINLFCHIFLYRVWTLYVAHSTTDRKKRVADEGETASLVSVDKLTWRQRLVNRFKYASDSFAGWFLFCTGVLAIGPVFAFTPVAAPKDGNLSLCDGCNMTPPFIFLFVEIIIYATIFAIMSFKFSKKENDNFNIKGELRFAAFTTIAGVIPWVVASVGFGDFNNYTFRVSAVVPIIAMLVIAVYSNFYTIYQSYQITFLLRDHRRQSFVIEQSTEMKLVLLMPEGFQAFKNFLSKEFAVENILFWHEARIYREFTSSPGYDREKAIQMAKGIYENYFKEGSVLQVNVNYTVASDISAIISTIVETGKSLDNMSTIFVEAEKHIFAVMLHDPYPRFTRSPEYDSIRDQVARAKLEYTMHGPDGDRRLSTSYENSQMGDDDDDDGPPASSTDAIELQRR